MDQNEPKSAEFKIPNLSDPLSKEERERLELILSDNYENYLESLKSDDFHSTVLTQIEEELDQKLQNIHVEDLKIEEKDEPLKDNGKDVTDSSSKQSKQEKLKSKITNRRKIEDKNQNKIQSKKVNFCLSKSGIKNNLPVLHYKLKDKTKLYKTKDLNIIKTRRLSTLPDLKENLTDNFIEHEDIDAFINNIDNKKCFKELEKSCKRHAKQVKIIDETLTKLINNLSYVEFDKTPVQNGKKNISKRAIDSGFDDLKTNRSIDFYEAKFEKMEDLPISLIDKSEFVNDVSDEDNDDDCIITELEAKGNDILSIIRKYSNQNINL